ncbi:phytoene desaturase family protein [Heliophilum fasciatum]|uniref:Phytoene desaturase n=1 Tax=Heliophilum fasciatum TaxID=35700 RepID=A0A4R2S8D6_9FIRM|nr:phytoene desaturase family protein [Heliophilum fasciatum]MCW2276858.1 phytoene desaturase [Heliophilum fasciatum]TCP68681.1 phytoene desaturase [Heliophilum fasciatum]
MAPTTNKRTAIIVGAGAAGLSTAVRLAHQGWDVTIFEKEKTPGGRLSAVEENGYTIDIGPTILLMDDVFRQLFADVGRKLEDYLELVRLNPLYQLCFSDGTVLPLPSTTKELLDEIRRINPDDVDGYLQFLAQSNDRYRAVRENFFERPMNTLGELLSMDSLFGFYRLKTLTNMYADISRYIADERLRLALTFGAIYMGVSPYSTPSAYTIISYVEHAVCGVWYPKGGMNKVSKALVKLLGEFGGQLQLGREVSEIIIENGHARGVRLANGETHHADVVISNVDFPTSMEKLVSPPYRGKHTTKNLESMTNSCGALMFYLGINHRYDHLDVHNIYFTSNFKKTMDQIFEAKVFPDEPAIYLYSPTRIDPSMAPEGKEVLYILVPAPNMSSSVDWIKDVPRFRDIVMSKLERSGLTNLRQHIEFERVYTPQTFEQRFNLYQGAAFGLAPTLFQSAYFRPRITSDKVDNLYFTGASVHPGGGVPVVMVCAKLVTDLILKDHGYTPVWADPKAAV